MSIISEAIVAISIVALLLYILFGPPVRGPSSGRVEGSADSPMRERPAHAALWGGTHGRASLSHGGALYDGTDPRIHSGGPLIRL